MTVEGGFGGVERDSEFSIGALRFEPDVRVSRSVRDIQSRGDLGGKVRVLSIQSRDQLEHALEVVGGTEKAIPLVGAGLVVIGAYKESGLFGKSYRRADYIPLDAPPDGEGLYPSGWNLNHDKTRATIPPRAHSGESQAMIRFARGGNLEPGSSIYVVYDRDSLRTAVLPPMREILDVGVDDALDLQTSPLSVAVDGVTVEIPRQTVRETEARLLSQRESMTSRNQFETAQLPWTGEAVPQAVLQTVKEVEADLVLQGVSGLDLYRRLRAIFNGENYYDNDSRLAAAACQRVIESLLKAREFSEEDQAGEPLKVEVV